MKTSALAFVTSLVLGLSALGTPALASAQEAPVMEEAYAPGPPPAAPVEVMTVAPYPGAVWVGGHYRFYGHRWVWNRGAWSRPRPGYVFQPHRWERRGARYTFVRGGWHRR